MGGLDYGYRRGFWIFFFLGKGGNLLVRVLNVDLVRGR